MAEHRLDKAGVGARGLCPRSPRVERNVQRASALRVPTRGYQFQLGVAQMAARVIWDHEGHRRAEEPMTVRDLPPRPDKRALGCGRSSMAEPWAVNPLVPVRLRPVTPKRMHFEASRTRAAENRVLTPDGQGSSPWRRTTQQPPRGGIGRRTGLRNRSPQGMSVRLGPRGPAGSPVAQRQSSALIRRRPVDRAHPGRPTTSEDQDPSTTKEVCHETDQ